MRVTSRKETGVKWVTYRLKMDYCQTTIGNGPETDHRLAIGESQACHRRITGRPQVGYIQNKIDLEMNN